MRRPTVGVSRTSPRMRRAPAGTRAGLPTDRSSRATTSYPRWHSNRQRADPMNPAPPVTRTLSPDIDASSSFPLVEPQVQLLVRPSRRVQAEPLLDPAPSFAPHAARALG